MKIVSIIFVGVLCAIGASQNLPVMVQRVLPQNIADTFGAKCLAGEPPQYYIRANKSSDRWILFLEGGGWCYGATANETIDSCARRGGFNPPRRSDTYTSGSGNNNKYSKTSWNRTSQDMSDVGGILSANPSINPDFYTWNAVFIHYCDGASMGSDRTDPIAVKTKDGKPAQLWMRGRSNFNAVIHDLQITMGMNSATEIILSGGSAGGLAVFYNLDHLTTLVAKTVRVTGFPDAGFFLDHPSVSGAYNYRANFQGADPVWNVTGSGGTNLACLASNPGASSWKCLMAPYIVQYIQTPIYVMNSAYDAWQLPNILQDNCISTKDKACNDTAPMNYGAAFKQAIAEVLTISANNGVYVDSCYVHEQNVNYCSSQSIPNCVGWTPASSGDQKWGYTTAVTAPDGTSLTPQEAFSAYYFHGKYQNLIDNTTVQNNPTCIYLGHPA
eukprot:m.572245 g.572245  ORF g.572245 m.572245 type:complete len:442 (-) comp22269_c0_seq4:1603-2928(-)